MVSSSSSRSGPRPGGRSARVQAAVHAAVKQLQQEAGSDGGEGGMTVPLVAARAGVTPSTIYRRWGDLAELLADVAVERMRPDTEPPDTGSLAGDLSSWAEQYLEEMSSEVGRAMMKDVLAGTGQSGGLPASCRCFEFTQSQLEIMLVRARERGEADLPASETLMDTIVAPIIYRILFAPQPPEREWLQSRLRELGLVLQP